MNKNELLKKLNGIKIEYKKVLKIEEFKQFKKDLKTFEEFTTKITSEENTTTKTQKLSINNKVIENFKNLIDKITNEDTKTIVKNASNNQIKKSLALAIFENTTNTLKLAIKTNTTKLYNYEDITKVFATLKTTIENLKTQNKTKSICVDITTNTLKFVDANEMYNKLMKQKQQERKNKVQERKNKKQIENKKAQQKKTTNKK